jgi:transposase
MKIVEMLRLNELGGLSHRQIATGAGCGKSTVSKVLKLCKDKGLTCEIASLMTDEELNAALYPKTVAHRANPFVPDWKAVHEELTRNKNLNLQFLWEEYHLVYPEGLGYSQFCKKYRAYREKTGKQPSLHHERKAGEIMEVDWMGDKLACVVDKDTGELTEAHFFVAILGYSGFPYL